MTVNVIESADMVLIKLKYHAKDCEITSFRCKMSCTFEKIFKAFADREGTNANSFRFVLDGKRVNPLSTPEMEGMLINDDVEIDVMIDAVGGGFPTLKW